jgi:hypothetical protein
MNQSNNYSQNFISHGRVTNMMTLRPIESNEQAEQRNPLESSDRKQESEHSISKPQYDLVLTVQILSRDQLILVIGTEEIIRTERNWYPYSVSTETI